jgi:hypothetical protein
MCAFQQAFKIFISNGQRDRQPDGAPQTISSTYPVPENKHIRFVYAKCFDLFCICAQRDKVFAMNDSSIASAKNHSLAVCALVMVSSVVNVLEAIRKIVSPGVIFFSTSAI